MVLNVSSPWAISERQKRKKKDTYTQDNETNDRDFVFLIFIVLTCLKEVSADYPCWWMNVISLFSHWFVKSQRK